MESKAKQDKKWMAPFFTIWTGQAFSLLGSQLVQFALIWWITATTGSAAILITATLMEVLPRIFIGPFAGALVDRWNRRRVMIVADSMIALATIFLVYLSYAGLLQPWHIYLLMAVRATGGTFHWPAMDASVALMVPKDNLARIAGLNQSLHGVLNIAIPPLGALIISLLPLHSVLAIDVVTAIIAVVPLFFVHIPQPEVAAEVGEDGAQSSMVAVLFRDIRMGFLYIWDWKGLVVIIGMATVINMLVNPGFQLMPLLVTEYFGLDAFALGSMESGWGLGFLAGSLLLGAWGGFRRKIVTSMASMICMGVGLLFVGFAPASLFWMALVGMTFAGFMNPILNGPFIALLQVSVVPEMQGRVFTLVNSLVSAVSPIGYVASALLADKLGVQWWFVVGGLACVVCGILGFSLPVVMNVEEEAQRERPVKFPKELPVASKV